MEAQVWVATVVIKCPKCGELIAESFGEEVQRDWRGAVVARKQVSHETFCPECLPDRAKCHHCDWEGPVGAALHS